MQERDKLTEARYFLMRMDAEHGDRTNFRFELSAFLGAARSVLQYALQEAQSKPGGQQWYHQAMTRDPLLGFFKAQRDGNIHTAPVTPATKMTTYVSEFLEIDEETVIPFKHYTGTYRHQFTDWNGEETVIELSERYVNVLQAVIDDGVAQGMITG